MAASNQGLWFDHDTGKVVRSQPARGRQLVAAGKELSDDEVQAIVDRYTQVETATAPDDTEKAVTTTKKASRSTKKKG